MSAQIEVSRKGYFNRITPEFVNEPFQKFNNITLPKKYYDNYEWSHIEFICSIEIKNSKSEIKRITIYPLNKDHFTFSETDSIWNDGEKAILKASNDWLMKDVIWELDNDMPEEAKELYTKFNKEKISLPYSGNSSFLIHLTICNNYHHYCGKHSFISSISIILDSNVD